MPLAIPTLGVTGWINDFSATADYLLACYITTNTSNSVLHNKQNTSMQYQLQEFAGRIQTLEENMYNDLVTKFQSTFGNTAEVTVEIEAEDSSKPDQYSIRFTATVYDGAKAYVVGKLVQYENGLIVSIAKINNG